MDDLFIINLRIADTYYPVRVRRSDEESFRAAAKEIDYKLSQYKNHFAGDPDRLDENSYMTMTAVQAVLENVDLKKRNETFEQKIRELTSEIEQYLRNR